MLIYFCKQHNKHLIPTHFPRKKEKKKRALSTKLFDLNQSNVSLKIAMLKHYESNQILSNNFTFQTWICYFSIYWEWVRCVWWRFHTRFSNAKWISVVKAFRCCFSLVNTFQNEPNKNPSYLTSITFPQFIIWRC